MKGVAAAAAAVLAVVLAGCTGVGSEAPTSSPTTAPTAPASPAADEAVPTPTVVEQHSDHEPPTSTDASSGQDAIDRATEAMRLFARPSLDAQTWIDELYPYLNERAGNAYANVDPANIPASAVTGAATLEAEHNDFHAVVVVPTDAGTYRVELERQSLEQPWLAVRIQPAG